MATSASLGFTSLLKAGNGASPQAFTTIAEVTDVTDFGANVEFVEVTNFDSTGGYREYIGGLKTPSNFTFSVNWLPAAPTQAALLADLNAGTTRAFKYQLPTGKGTYNFSAIVVDWKFSNNPAAAITGSFTLQVSGTITWQNLP